MEAMQSDPSQSRFDDMPIFLGPPGQRAGAVFSLSSAAPDGAEWDRGDGWSVRIRAGSEVIVASGGGDPDPVAAWRNAYAAAQEALDVWSTRGVANLQTREPYGSHLAFWDDANGANVRITGRSMLKVRVGPVSVVLHDAAGNVKPQPEPVEAWHQSMRFFRQSQLTNDIFDSLRSLWLALENLLDSIEPYKTGTDQEQVWLKRALRTAFTMLGPDYSRLPPHPSGKAPHNAAYSYFYDELRTHLFHAKASRQPTLPHDTAGIQDLTRRHERLTQFYLDLLAAATGVARLGSGFLAVGGFQMMVAPFEEDPHVLVTDDPSDFDPDEQRPAPSGGTVISGAAQRDPRLELPMLRVFRARFPGSDIARLSRITRILLASGTDLTSAHIPDGQLRLVDVDWVETQMEIGVTSVRPLNEFTAA